MIIRNIFVKTNPTSRWHYKITFFNRHFFDFLKTIIDDALEHNVPKFEVVLFFFIILNKINRKVVYNFHEKMQNGHYMPLAGKIRGTKKRSPAYIHYITLLTLRLTFPWAWIISYSVIPEKSQELGFYSQSLFTILQPDQGHV